MAIATSILLQLGFMLVTPDPSAPDNLFAGHRQRVSIGHRTVASVVATASLRPRRRRSSCGAGAPRPSPPGRCALALLAALAALFTMQAVDSSGPVVNTAGIRDAGCLAGLLRNRWSRAGAVGELVERLGVKRAH